MESSLIFCPKRTQIASNPASLLSFPFGCHLLEWRLPPMCMYARCLEHPFLTPSAVLPRQGDFVLLSTSLLSGGISGGSIWDCVEAGRQPVLCQGLHMLLMFPDVQEQGLRHSSLHLHGQSLPLWQLVPGLHPHFRVTASCGV